MPVDTSDPIFKDWLKDLLLAEDCTIEFVKTDGTIREMKCTLRHEVVQPYVKKSDRKFTPNSDVIRVWDLDKSDWRSIRYETIKVIRFTLGEARND